MTEVPITPDSPTTPDMVRWAFRTILNHHDVADPVIELHLREFPRFADLCEGLKKSEEFALIYRPPTASPAASPAASPTASPAASPDAESIDEDGLRTIIASLYRAFLGREADPVGMAHNLALLRQAGGLAGVGQLASLLERSTERALVDHLPACLQWITSEQGQPEEFAGRPVISLGLHCAPAMILKKTGLRRFSTPFDWTFSTPAMVRHCLEDGFRTFLDPRYHESVTRPDHAGRPEFISRHSLYNSKYEIGQPVFNHRDITRPDIAEYYRRCVGRFMDVVRGMQPVYLLQCVVHGGYGSADPVGEFRKTAALLGRLAPAASLAMFHITLKGGLMPEVELLEVQGKHRMFALRAVSVLGSLDFHEAVDQIGLLRALRWHARNPPVTAPPRLWEAQLS